MRLEHIAIWVADMEKMCDFYCAYFQATASDKYINPKTKFESYFLSFAQGGRLEIMYRPDIESNNSDQERTGLAHFSISTGSTKEVDSLTARLQQDGYKVISGPRTTGDGYYESMILDPENNRLEITV
ncbi:MAG: VOC family protein [Sedimentisphaerales bacterium]|nr:VOC family protein [Sedimentisphaerales bacterium]MBN2843275.1 VOC family protein [Sedimentisphaerales bacterium]